MLVVKRILTVLLLIIFMLPVIKGQPAVLEADQVNLALRRTADQLLRASGDQTSRIPAIEQTDQLTWRIRMQHRFEYDSLPRLLQASLARYDIGMPYRVAVKRCDTEEVDLGYVKEDFVRDSNVACMGREEPEGCHYIEVTFLMTSESKTFWASTSLLLVLTLVTGSGALMWYRKNGVPAEEIAKSHDHQWIPFGQCRLSLSGMALECKGQRVSLTYREAKLLRLLASHPDQVLERDVILNEVWGDEGIQVSRSVDMFISRLRKKIAADDTVSIVAVHGVGYRLETGLGA